MKIGIISDSHDNMPKIQEAVKILNQNEVGFVVHCGDFIAPFSLAPLAGLACDWIGVFGNNDGEKTGLSEKSGGKIKQSPHFIEIHHKKVAIMHEFSECDADIICFGHSHKAQVSTKANRIFINPGEVCGWLFGKSSLAILDPDSMKAELLYF